MLLVMEDDRKSKHACKFCRKTFPCGRSLGGHMRSHLISISPTQKKLPPLTISLEDAADKKKPNKARRFADKTTAIQKDDDDDDSCSDNEATLCRKKRSERPKRYTNSFEQEEQEEVALSLILLSMDCVSSSVVDSYNTMSSSSTSADHCLKFKKLNTEFRAPTKRLKSSAKFDDSEVNSPKRNGSLNPFGSDLKRKSKKNSNIISEVVVDYKFTCIICKKGFSSYQALGGHRASHKKFKGCCAPTSHEFQEKSDKISKDHECPICLRVFPSGQALGGHKRSHLITDQANNSDGEIRGFLDLNLPAPVEEDCNQFKPWWIGLLSSS